VAGATATAMAAGKIFPLIEDEGMTPTDGGGDELGDVGGGCKSWRLRVKETLRAFSTYYLHFVQVFPSR
jgi:[histone H3]-lysine9 N-trimethyltransferase EHMT